MKEQWEKWENLLAARSLRERVILLITALVALAFIWLQFVYTPMDKRIQRQGGEIARINAEVETAASEMALLESQLKVDPNQLLREEQDQLKAELDRLRTEMQNRLKEMVAPAHMADLLRQVLSEFSGLKVVSVKNRPVHKLVLKGEDSVPAGKSEDQDLEVPIFQHDLELVFEGGFFDSLNYLRRLESLEEQFQWDMLDMVVIEFPKMKISLRVQTLSLEEEWIGV